MASRAWAALQGLASLIEDACRLLLSISSQHVTQTARRVITVWLQVWFSTMAESYEKAFDMYVGVSDPQKLNSFWTAQLQGSPYLGGRPELLPMALHGDGVSVTGLGKTWQKGIDAYSTPSPQFSLSVTLATIIRCWPWFRENSRSMNPCLGLVCAAVVRLACSLFSPRPWISFTGL